MKQNLLPRGIIKYNKQTSYQSLGPDTMITKKQSTTNTMASLIARFMGPTKGPIWGRQDPGGPHVGPMDFAIWDISYEILCVPSFIQIVTVDLTIITHTRHSCVISSQCCRTTFTFETAVFLSRQNWSPKHWNNRKTFKKTYIYHSSTKP